MFETCSLIMEGKKLTLAVLSNSYKASCQQPGVAQYLETALYINRFNLILLYITTQCITALTDLIVNTVLQSLCNIALFCRSYCSVISDVHLQMIII